MAVLLDKARIASRQKNVKFREYWAGTSLKRESLSDLRNRVIQLCQQPRPVDRNIEVDRKVVRVAELIGVEQQVEVILA